MQQYLDLLHRALHFGRREENRTGIDALVTRPAMMEFDLADGFPAVTTKKLAFNACKGEFIAFMQGKTSAADFRALGCNFWDQNANENRDWRENPYRTGTDDLGRIYGAQWRDWSGIDQVAEALMMIRANPTSRRIIISAWNPPEFEQMALPPCHVMYQFMVDTQRQELSLAMYQRSGDLFLGVPMNVASCGLMLSLFAELTGLRPRYISHFIAIPHLYVNHIEQAKAQLERIPGTLPRLGFRLPLLGMASDEKIIDALTPECFWLDNYFPAGALPAPMAV